MPTTPLVESGLRRALRLSLTGLALLFWGAALSALLGHGPRISLGPVRISALDASRAADCRACGLCVAACPEKAIRLSAAPRSPSAA